MRHYLYILLSGFISGIFVGIGTTIYLSLLALGQGEYIARLIGSLFFAFGSLSILTYETWFYTGKATHIIENKPKYLLDLLLCSLTNIIGVVIFCLIVDTTRLSPDIKAQAILLVETKQNDTWYSMLILSILCGIVVGTGVKGYQVCPNPIGKITILFLAISLFIICGFENVFANAGYYALAEYFDAKSLGYFILCLIGNGIGAFIIGALLHLEKKLKASSQETNKKE